MANRFTFIDLEKEFATLRDNIAFQWVALRSMDLTKRCLECRRYTEPNYDQAKPSCTQCYGSGHLGVDYLIRVYKPRVQPGFDFLIKVGLVQVPTQIFYMESGNTPKNTDFILELDLDENGDLSPDQPYVITSVYKIQDVHSLKGKNGKVIYYKILANKKLVE